MRLKRQTHQILITLSIFYLVLMLLNLLEKLAENESQQALESLEDIPESDYRLSPPTIM